ncbi:GrpB family protein [Bacillus sp. 37MA]|uniref:GrpB family protein n=1 Tax=Bacillus sp. 37MA TaxID=1132442 RepID=UPI00037CCE8A|nr:GrpB family protein [Bacillus sp. 37MA]
MINRAMNIIVTDYDDDWIQFFRTEAKKIREIFKDEIVEIHHIGSTAVPGLKAKPIIDIMSIVKDIKIVDTFNAKMVEIGYEALGELGIRGRRYFRKGGENRTHQIHIFQFDNEFEIERHLAVREYLISHKDEAIKYGELKERLAVEFPKDIEGYSDGKDNFVKNLERRAIEWRQKNKR